MGMMANIACKTVGIAGMSAVLYDAYSLGSKNSKRNMQKVNADHFEKVIADTRTLSSESAVSGAMQKKVADTLNNIKKVQNEKFNSIDTSFQSEKKFCRKQIVNLTQKIKISYIVAGTSVAITIIHITLNILGVM